MANAFEEYKTSSSKSASFFMKVVVVGDSGVGKTSILQSYVNGNVNINNDYKATIGSDLYMTDIKIEDNYAQLQIWDTAGQERFNSLSKQIYRGTDILILVYDITNLESFTNIEHWKNEFLSNLSDDHPNPFPILLLGNKFDLVEQNDNLRKVSLEKASEYALGHDMQFKEVSALTKINIHPSIQTISMIAMNYKTVPLVYKIDNSFVLPSKYYEDDDRNTNKINDSQSSSSCYCQLL